MIHMDSQNSTLAANQLKIYSHAAFVNSTHAINIIFSHHNWLMLFGACDFLITKFVVIKVMFRAGAPKAHGDKY